MWVSAGTQWLLYSTTHEQRYKRCNVHDFIYTIYVYAVQNWKIIQQLHGIKTAAGRVKCSKRRPARVLPWSLLPNAARSSTASERAKAHLD